MYLIYGLVLIAAAIVMLAIGRPAKGMEAAPFLRVWIVGQAYITVVLVAFVIGTSFVIMSLPG